MIQVLEVYIMNLTEKVEFHTEFNVILHWIEIIMILLIWILVQIPGNLMLYLLIQFDRLGGDPMKRRLVDQVWPKMCIYKYI